MKLFSVCGLIVAAVSFASFTFVNSVHAEDSIATPIAAEIGQIVQLDPTDGFIADSSIALRPVWSWISRPAISVADISDVTALRPSFTVDVDGTYIAQLELFDAAESAITQAIHSLTVEVGTGNLTPVAHTVARGTPQDQTTLILDATQSYDVDGNALSYSWSVDSAPMGAVVTIVDGTAPLSEVQFDQNGEYVIALVVQDANGVSSKPSHIRFSYQAARTGGSHGKNWCEDGGGHDDEYGRKHGDWYGSGHIGKYDRKYGDWHGGGHDDEYGRKHGDGYGGGHDGKYGRKHGDWHGGGHDDEYGRKHGDGYGGGHDGKYGRKYDDWHGGGHCTKEAGRQVAPVAKFALEQVRGSIGTRSTLGSHASTDVDGDALIAEYSIAVAPTSSASTIAQDQDGFAAITPDLVGDYLVSLGVSDGSDFGYDQILIVTDPAANIRPVARIATVSNPVTGMNYGLNGTQSYDFDGDLLTYKWSVLYKPTTSAAQLTNGADPYAEIVPDVPGLYIVQLSVNDGTTASVPVTMAMVVDGPLPVAHPGADILVEAQSATPLDGTLSSGIAPVYNWSVLGLTSDGHEATLEDPALAMPGLMHQTRTAAFREVIKSASVYHLKSNNSSGLCSFDTRLPSDIPNVDPNGPIRIKLAGRGKQIIDGQSIFVWEIENKKDATQTVRLETQSGLVVGTYVVPGRVSVHVTTHDIGADKLGAWVGGTLEALKPKKTNPFNRNNPVCTGGGSTVVQLIVSDANGISLPETVFVSPGNLRPVLTPTTRVLAETGTEISLSATDYDFDANSDSLSFSWSVLYRPHSSQTSVDSDPLVKIATGEALAITPDRSGLYLIQITAVDGILLAYPAVIEIEVQNAAPVAIATGPAQVFVGETATLDGSGSYDPDGDALSYQWTITSQPNGSAAVISGSSDPIAAFVPDTRGDYVFSLTVSDFELTSTAAVVMLTAPNRAPLAELVGLTDVIVGDEVALSASASIDPDGDELSYAFAVLQAPVGANPTLIDLTEGAAGFVADVGGSYTIQVTVSDGLTSTVATLDIVVTSGNTAPVLGQINTLYTVELGLELALDLTGSDPDGDATFFFATPLPLPAGITLDSSNGQVRFRPESGQEGSYAFTVGISDGSLTDTAALNIDVVSGTASDTSVYGRVLDAVDFADGIETPLAGMPVRLRDAALMAVTDANGAFDFGSLTAGQDQILVEPSASGGPGGYIGTIRAIRITENQNRDLAPNFLLTPLNDGCATAVVGQETVLSGLTSGVSVTIAADTIQTTAGDPYVGDICLGSLPELFSQSGLPSDTQACRIYALDAPGAVFTQGIAVSAPNVDQLPEQTRLHLWSQSVSNGLFRRSANADVDSGGTTVSSMATSFSDSTLFTFLPKAPQTATSTDQPTGNRTLSVFEGDLSETYTLPGYRAFNRNQQVGLSYHSTTADPKIIVAGDVTIAADASLPATLSTRLDIGGLSVSDDADWTPRQGLNGTTPALVGEAVSMRQSMLLDASNLSSGQYDYTFIAKAQFACSTVSSSHTAELYVQNETNSPYGVGWSIDGLQELTVNPDGSVAVIDDDGISTFDPKPTFTDFDDEPVVFPAVGAQSVNVGDYNGDGLLDISFGDSGTGNIGLITNYGGRDLQLDTPLKVGDPREVPTTGSYGPNLLGIASGEFSNDVSPDLAYALQIQNGYGFVENDGFGNFSNDYVLLGMGSRPLDLTVEDIDGDGFDDIIYTAFFGFFSINTDEIWVDYGGASGRTRARIAAQGFGDLPFQVSTGDIDGNGQIDVAYRTAAGLNFVFNNGNRNYTLSAQGLGGGPISKLGKLFQLLDANGDGMQDIVWIGDNLLQVYLNTSGRVFDAPIDLARPPSISGTAAVNVADTNGDNIDDIILSSSGSTTGEVAVYIGRGDGTYEPFELGLVSYPLNTIAIADVNGDGSLDLVSTQRFSVTVHFSKPSANGQFVSGKGEFSTLTKLPDGTWQRRYKDGNIVEFNADGLQTAEIDPEGNRRVLAYGVDRRLTTVTDQVGGVTQFAYDGSGRLASISYPDGRETLFTYDDQKLATITEPAGGTVGFTYDDSNRLITTTNQNGNTSLYTYDATGKMSGATLPDGSSIKNQVAASLGLVDGLGGPPPIPRIFVAPEDRVTTVTDRKGQTTEIVVNQFGATVKITDALGRVTAIERDENNLATRVERPGSEAGTTRVDTIAYDSIANITQKTEAVGTAQQRSTSYEYETTFNKVTRMVDADGFETLYTYDATGNALTVSDAEGGLRQFSYTAEGKLATNTDENGNTTTSTYNADQNLSQMTFADGSVTQMSYDTSGNSTLIAEATGTPIERQIQRTYDALNRVLTVEVTAADGAQIDGLTTYAYDPVGNLASVIDETGLTTSMTYDALERLTAVNDPAEGLIQRSYNAAGEVVQHTNGDGETHAYAYDPVSRLIQTTDPEGFVKAFAYDPRDNIKTVTDGRGGLTAFGYDALDRMATRTNPIGQTMSRAYNQRDNLITLTREDGTVETATYDGLSRRTQVVTPDNTLTYAYDARSNLTEAADNDSRVTFTYDLRNRLETTTTDGTVGPQPQVTLTYAYDALDRRLSMSDSLGGTTQYAYDPEDRLTELTAPWGTVYSFGYDGEGRRTSLTSTSGRMSNYGYTNGLLTALSHAQSGVPLTDLSYEYDVDGQLAAILDAIDPAKSKFISYDDLNRLVLVDEGIPPLSGGTPLPVEDYAYDEEGNRTASHLSALYASNDHNQLLEDEDFAYAYDAKGNRVSKTAKVGGEVESYIYDSQSRLVSYTSPTTNATYAYDALNRRVAKSVDGNVTASVYDLWGTDTSTASDILMDFEGGVLTRRWAHSGRVDEPLSHEQYSGDDTSGSGSVYEMYADRMGSISKVVDVATGAVVAEYAYDAFGGQTQFAGALFQYYGYTGRETDGESGLIYYRARTYDPATGQFLQRDPIGFAAGDLNLYAYVGNNPYTYLDPSGMSSATMEDLKLTGAGMTIFATAGNSILQGALGINLRLSEIAVFSKSPNDDDTNSDSPDGGSDECGPGGGGGGGDDSDGFLRNIIRNWRNILIFLMTIDPSGESGMQSNSGHVKHMETAAKISAAQRRTKRDDEEQNDDDDKC